MENRLCVYGESTLDEAQKIEFRLPCGMMKLYRLFLEKEITSSLQLS